MCWWCWGQSGEGLSDYEKTGRTGTEAKVTKSEETLRNFTDSGASVKQAENRREEKKQTDKER